MTEDTETGWQPGDRVKVRLPDRSRPAGVGYTRSWFTGTVRLVNPPGLPAGVKVDFDRAVNGIRDCYATHAELVAEDSPQPAEGRPA